MTNGTQRWQWRGADHIALTTRDLDATVRFYHNLLDMPLIGAMGPMPYHGPHVLLDAGGFLMHFFEQPENEVSPVPAGWSSGFRIWPGCFQHLALAVAGEDDLVALRDRLMAAGVEVTSLMSQGPLRQFIFTDNNGIMVEVNWTPADFADLPAEERDAMMFTDLNSVPAVQEIRAKQIAG